MRKNVRYIGVVVLSALLLCSCGNAKNEEIASEYMEKVAQLEKSGVPTMQDVKALDEEYYNLTPKQKDLVTNYGTVKKYLDMDLDQIHSIQDQINQLLSADNVSYKDVMQVEQEYNQLPSDEQAYITSIDRLDEYKELNEYDKAAVVATNFLKDSLKDSSSLQLDEINVKKEGYYYVKINYSATNGFGGRVEDVACLDVTDTYKMGLIALSILTGKFDEGSNTLLGGYIGFKVKEVPVDCEKVMANLNTTIN